MKEKTKMTKADKEEMGRLRKIIEDQKAVVKVQDFIISERNKEIKRLYDIQEKYIKIKNKMINIFEIVRTPDTRRRKDPMGLL